MGGHAPTEEGVHIFGMIFILAMCLMMWTAKRKSAFIPILITCCYIPLGQAFIIGGLHFQFLRVLLLVGLFRVLSRKESSDFQFTIIDKIFLWWAVASVILGTLCDSSRLVNRMGEFYNAAGAYFLVRCWVRDLDDVIGMVRFMAFMIVPLAVFMCVEKYTGRNWFSLLGGVPEMTGLREGKVRCQGAFRHAILAGSYAATCLPLFIGLWYLKGRNRFRAMVGMGAALFCTFAATSSGALLALMSSIIAIALWPIRLRMRMVRWGILLAIVALSMVMNARVWYIFAKISDITGGTGWHRSYLMDQAYNHFNEWWMFGTRVTKHWAPGGGAQVLENDPNNMDITNHYIAEGIDGGIIKLALFVAMIVFSFKIVGRWMRLDDLETERRQKFIWALGAVLLGHCISFMSVVYFDQIILMWYWLLGIMAMLYAESVKVPETETVAEEVEAPRFEAEARVG